MSLFKKKSKPEEKGLFNGKNLFFLYPDDSLCTFYPNNKNYSVHTPNRYIFKIWKGMYLRDACPNPSTVLVSNAWGDVLEIPSHWLCANEKVAREKCDEYNKRTMAQLLKRVERLEAEE